MFRITVLLIILISNMSYADQGVNISCVNMKSMLGKDYKILNFKLDVVSFQYFDEDLNQFKKIDYDKLIISENFFAARFRDYELGFQINEPKKDDENPVMTMSKYDYKNGIFLEHYVCSAKGAYIE